MSRVADILTKSYAATAGGEDGLVSAVARAGQELKGLSLASWRIENAALDWIQKTRGRLKRDPFGVVLTSPALADRLMKLMDEVGPNWRSGTVLDPSAGTGRLLRAARRAGARELEGWEIDPVVRSLAIHVGGTAASNFRLADGLAERRPSAKRLSVVANPPFVAAFGRASQADALDIERLERVVGRWGSGRVHLGVAFVARIVRDLLRPGEVGGLVLPDPVTNAASYHPMRREMMRYVDRLVVEHLDESAFVGRGVRAVLMAFRRGEEPVEEDANSLLGEILHVRASKQSTQRLAEDEAKVSPLLVWAPPTPERARVRELIRRDMPRLGDIFEVRDGVNPGGREAREQLVRESADEMTNPRPLLEGKDIHAFELGHSRLFIESDPLAIRSEWSRGGTSLRSPGLFEGPRLYSRQTTGRLTVAFCDDDSMALNSVHVIMARSPADQRRDLERLEAYLNTRFATDCYVALFAEDRPTFPQVKVGLLRMLPVPWPFDDDMDAAVSDARDSKNADGLNQILQSRFSVGTQ